MKHLTIGLLFIGGLIAAGTVLGQDEMQQGKQVFTYWCINCHGDFPGTPGTQALQALYGDTKPAVLKERTDLTRELVEISVRNGVSIMPFFRKTEISDEDLDALATYLSRNTE
jgi:mono/diheme cytochrome c family protein